MRGKFNIYVLRVVIVLGICVLAIMGNGLNSKAANNDVEQIRKSKIASLVDVAKNEIGYTKDSSGWTKYGQWWTDRTGDSEYATANWACMFLSWCAKEAGITEDEFGYFSYTGYWISWFKENNAYNEAGEYNPESGDIVFFDNNNNGSVDTVGLVEKVSWGKISFIKGNVGGQVVRSKFDLSNETIMGYGKPLYTKNAFDNNGYKKLDEPITGIDVSSYNGTIDWEQVKASGIKYAYIRLGYRGYAQRGTLVTDKNFKTNIEGALNAGIDVGVYFVTQAITTYEAVEEADYVVDKIKHYNITYPVVIDTEEASPEERSKDLTRAQRTANIKAFCDRIEYKGYKSQIYSGKYWFRDKLIMEELEGYDIWIAEYLYDNTAHTTFAHPYSVWQYTDKGVVPGINGVCDLNLCYVDYIGEEERGGIKNFFENWFD